MTAQPERCISCPNRKANEAPRTLDDLCDKCHNLTEDQRIAIFDEMYERKVKQSNATKSSKGGKYGGRGRTKKSNSLVIHSVTRAIPLARMYKTFNISKRKHTRLVEVRRESPLLRTRIRKGELTIKQAQRLLRDEERQRQGDEALKTHGQDGQGIITGDYRIVLPPVLKPNSLDIIFTDPPWADMEAYADLAQFAATYLKPGAFCLVQFGIGYLHRVLSVMCEHLDYVWQSIITLKGKHDVMHDKGVTNGYKPILILAKPPRKKPKAPYIHDCLEGSGADKEHHKWGQHYKEYVDYIRLLTLPGALGCDPFVGGGPVPLAFKDVGQRRFIGAEKDPRHAAIARRRVDAFKATD